tara:strand:+ start:302 stop:475 length:174 start_codon:yes stop_codon:yes gene_type:complete
MKKWLSPGGVSKITITATGFASLSKVIRAVHVFCDGEGWQPDVQGKPITGREMYEEE